MQWVVVLAGLAAVAAAGLLPLPAMAGDSTDNNAPYTVTRDLNFRILYPRFLRFRVGATGAVINQITFNVLSNMVGNATPVAGIGGDAGGGTAANVQVVANNGQVTITATNNSGGLGLGTGSALDGRIDYAELSTSTSVPTLPPPALTNAGGTTSLPALTSAPYVTDLTAVWTYSYLNQTLPAAGTFGATANGGRVTYTATMP